MTAETAGHLPAMKLEARLAENAPNIATLVRMLGPAVPPSQGHVITFVLSPVRKWTLT